MNTKYTYKKLFYFIYIFLPLFICLILYNLSFGYNSFVEYFYSRGIYPAITYIGSFFTSFFPFSLGEILLITLIAFIVILVIFITFSIFKQKPFYFFLKRLLILFSIFALLYASFIGMWGFNYARLPLSTTLELDSSNTTKEELLELCVKLGKKATTLREEVHTDKNGVFVTNKSYEEINKSTKNIFTDYAPDFMKLGATTNVKGMQTYNALSILNITGIYCPFTFECNVNMQVPPLYFPATNIHEYAHFKGFAREDEANFISYYLSRNTEDTDYSYSATMLALNYSLNALYDTSKKAHSYVYTYILSDGVKKDFTNENNYWKTFDTPIAEQSVQVNDAYLKSNKQADGIQSYDRMVELLIALMRKNQL